MSVVLVFLSLFSQFYQKEEQFECSSYSCNQSSTEKYCKNCFAPFAPRKVNGFCFDSPNITCCVCTKYENCTGCTQEHTITVVGIDALDNCSCNKSQPPTSQPPTSQPPTSHPNSNAPTQSGNTPAIVGSSFAVLVVVGISFFALMRNWKYLEHVKHWINSQNLLQTPELAQVVFEDAQLLNSDESYSTPETTSPSTPVQNNSAHVSPKISFNNSQSQNVSPKTTSPSTTARSNSADVSHQISFNNNNSPTNFPPTFTPRRRSTPDTTSPSTTAQRNPANQTQTVSQIFINNNSPTYVYHHHYESDNQQSSNASNLPNQDLILSLEYQQQPQQWVQEKTPLTENLDDLT